MWGVEGGGRVRCQTFSFVLFSLFSRRRRAGLATVYSSVFGLATNTLNTRNNNKIKDAQGLGASEFSLNNNIPHSFIVKNLLYIWPFFRLSQEDMGMEQQTVTAHMRGAYYSCCTRKDKLSHGDKTVLIILIMAQITFLTRCESI